jgi:LPXTG-motif cell wall-anchored protein
MPTFMDFFVHNVWFFIIGGLLALAGLIGAILFIRKQGE